MSKLKIYTISENYIDYLSKFDTHISYNKNEKRPYLGVVLEINNCLYFAPMYSPKPQHLKYKNNNTFIRIKNKKDEPLGIIRFSEMLPVPQQCLNILNFNVNGKKYEQLLMDQYDFINKNIDKIYKKAENTYNYVIKKNAFYCGISCNFLILEEKCKEFENTI